ncbi:hypothetical protein [Terrihabitans sp. B22-R8]|uniref:hypothetical protein n=1 Tax=Terrihabitans sp. B22-R8 TaxID=3425128 RepID=UPI00403C0279
MIIALLAIALTSGLGAIVLLWPFSPILALLAGPFVASGIVLAVALLANCRAIISGRKGDAINDVRSALSRLRIR